jgi:hypothetical protein
VSPPVTRSARTPRALRAFATRRAALIAGGIVTAVLVAPLLVGGTWSELDLQRLELALLCAYEEQERLGHGDWLFTTIANGAPRLGWPSSLLYPLRWLQRVLPIDLATALHPIVHLGLGAAAMAWLARTFRLGLWSAAGAAVLFALSGTVLDLIAKPYYAAGALYLPLVWAATRAALHPRGGARHVALIGVALTLQLLGGEVHTTGMITAIVLLECLLAWRRGVPRARMIAIALAVVGAVAIGWLQWGPTVAEGQLTSRTGALRHAYTWSFEPLGWWSALWPGVANQHVTPGLQVAAFLKEAGQDLLPWNVRAYAGWVAVLAMFLGVGSRRVRPAAIVFVGALLASLGDQTPLLPALHAVVPPLDRFRYPAKYLVPAMAGGAICASAFFAALLRDAVARRRYTLLLSLALAANVAGLVIVFVQRARIDAAFHAVSNSVRTGLPEASELLLQAGAHSSAAVLLALLAPRWLPWGWRVLPAIVAVDLLIAVPAIVDVHPPLAREVGVLAALRAPDDAAVADVPVVCIPERLTGLRVILEADGMSVADARGLRHHGIPELQSCDGVAGAWAYSAPLLPRTVEHLKYGLDARNVRAAQALGCTHVLDERAPDGGATRLAEPFRPGGAYFNPAPLAPRVYEITDAAPAAFVARDARWIEEKGYAARVRDAPDLSTMLSWVDDPGGRSPGQPPLPDGAGVQAVELEWKVRDRARLTARGSGGAVLGLRNTYWMGWRAEQAGEPLPVVRVAGTMVGVIVQDVGRGPVVLTYRAPGWSAAWFVAALGLVLVMLATWIRRSRGRGSNHANG